LRLSSPTGEKPSCALKLQTLESHPNSRLFSAQRPRGYKYWSSPVSQAQAPDRRPVVDLPELHTIDIEVVYGAPWFITWNKPKLRCLRIEDAAASLQWLGYYSEGIRLRFLDATSCQIIETAHAMERVFKLSTLEVLKAVVDIFSYRIEAELLDHDSSTAWLREDTEIALRALPRIARRFLRSHISACSTSSCREISTIPNGMRYIQMGQSALWARGSA
jgi:hypothetical protein